MSQQSRALELCIRAAGVLVWAFAMCMLPGAAARAQQVGSGAQGSPASVDDTTAPSESVTNDSTVNVHLDAHLGATGSGTLSRQAMGTVQRRHARSKAHFVEGLAATKVGAWAQAVQAFTESVELVARPNTLFNLALAQAQLGQSAAAYMALQRYLELLRAHGPDAKREDAYADAEAFLEQLRTQVALLRLEVVPSGARVVLDGIQVESTITEPTKEQRGLAEPAEGALTERWVQAVTPGSHQIDVSAPGYQRLKRTLVASAGSGLTVRLRLEREVAARPELGALSAPVAPVAIPGPVRPVSTTRASSERVEHGPSLWTDPWLWTAGVGVAVAVGAIVLFSLDARDPAPEYMGTSGLSL